MDTAKADVDHGRDEVGGSVGDEAERCWVGDLPGRLSVEHGLEVTSKGGRNTAMGGRLNGFVIAGEATVALLLIVAWVFGRSAVECPFGGGGVGGPQSSQFRRSYTQTFRS